MVSCAARAVQYYCTQDRTVHKTQGLDFFLDTAYRMNDTHHTIDTLQNSPMWQLL